MKSGDEAVTEIDAARWREAIRRSTFANYHLEMAVATEREGAVEAAIAHYRLSLSYLADQPEAHLCLTELLRRQGHRAEADAAHRAALAADANYRYRGLVAVALRQAEQKQVDEALGSLVAAEQAGAPSSILAAVRSIVHLAAGNDEAIQQELGALSDQAVLEEFGLADRLITAGYAALGRQAWTAGAVDFGTVFRLAPGRIGVREALALAYCHRMAGQLDLAVEAAMAALQQEPDRVEILIQLGVIHQNRGLWREAEGCFRRAVALAPGDPWPSFHLAILLLLAGRAEEAIDACNQGLALQPGSGWGHLYRSAALLALGQPEEAERSIDAAQAHSINSIQAHPIDSIWIAYYRAALDLEVGRIDTALARLEQAILGHDGPPLSEEGLIYLLKAGICRASGRLEEALDAYRRAMDRSPEQPWGGIGTAATLVDLGRLEEAERTLAAQQASFGEHPWTFVQLARLAKAKGIIGFQANAARQAGEGQPGIGWAAFFLAGSALAKRDLVDAGVV